MINPRHATKICRVCGDKASAFNFNGLTCECCKIFFRRNALNSEKLKCKRTRKCEIDFVTRKSCPACRLDKCFLIGMKLKLKSGKDLSKDAHFELTHNHNSDSSSSSSYENDQNIRNILESDLSDCSSDQNDFTEFFPSLQLNKQSTQLDPYELAHIEEVQSAISIFENENNLPVLHETLSLIDCFNLPCNYARRIVKFCKNISAFKSLTMEDQFKILKPFYFEICSVRFAFYYNKEQDCIPMIANESGNQVLLSSWKLFESFTQRQIANINRRILYTFHLKMENDPLIRDLLIAQFLFKPRENVTCPEYLRYRFYVYCRLLSRYMESKYKNSTQAQKKYSELMEFLHSNLDVMRENLIKLLNELDRSQLAQLMVEVFSLK